MSLLTPRIIAPRVSIADDWAHKQGMKTGEYLAVTKAASLRGLPANIEIIVVDTTVEFDDIQRIEATLMRFTNVRHAPY